MTSGTRGARMREGPAPSPVRAPLLRRETYAGFSSRRGNSTAPFVTVAPAGS